MEDEARPRTTGFLTAEQVAAQLRHLAAEQLLAVHPYLDHGLEPDDEAAPIDAAPRARPPWSVRRPAGPRAVDDADRDLPLV